MNAYQAYKQRTNVASTRIDLLLAVFDGAMKRISSAEALIKEDQQRQARMQILQAQLLVGELAAGVRVDVAPEMGHNMLRLYHFTVRELEKGSAESLAAALNVLRTLREGFEAIRPEAVALERSGRIPPVDSTSVLSTMA